MRDAFLHRSWGQGRRIPAPCRPAASAGKVLTVLFIAAGALSPLRLVTAQAPDATSLRAGSYVYQGQIGRNAPKPFALEIRVVENGNVFAITETAYLSESLTSTDRAILAKPSLHVRERHVQQGPLEIDLTFTEGQARGMVSVNGKTTTVDVPVPQPLFADGGGANLVLGTLPLVVGFETTVHNFNVRERVAFPRIIRVVGTETIDTPSGRFETFKLEVRNTSPAGDVVSVWIDRRTRVLVRAASDTFQYHLIPRP